MNTVTALPPRARRRSQAGLSLIELMIALTIGSFIVLVVSSLFANVSKGYRLMDDSSRATENGAFALKALVDDLRMAGYIGYSNDPARVEVARTLAATGSTNNCGSTDWPFQFVNATGAQTYLEFAPNLSTSNPFPCIPNAAFATDSPGLVVRRASGFAVVDSNANGDLSDDFADTDNQIYLQSSQSGAIIFMGKDYATQIKGAGRHRQISQRSNLGVVTTVDAPAFEFVSNIYYIRPCSRPTGSGGACQSTDDNGLPIPTLVRRQLTHNDPASYVETAVAEGVERIGLQVGIDNNLDGVPDRYAAATADNIADATTVRLFLLIRSRKPLVDYDDSQYTYDLGSTTYNCATAACKPYRRTVVSDTIQMKNYVYRR